MSDWDVDYTVDALHLRQYWSAELTGIASLRAHSNRRLGRFSNIGQQQERWRCGWSGKLPKAHRWYAHYVGAIHRQLDGSFPLNWAEAALTAILMYSGTSPPHCFLIGFTAIRRRRQKGEPSHPKTTTSIRRRPRVIRRRPFLTRCSGNHQDRLPTTVSAVTDGGTEQVVHGNRLFPHEHPSALLKNTTSRRTDASGATRMEKLA